MAGLKQDCQSDDEALRHINTSLEAMHDHFNIYYVNELESDLSRPNVTQSRSSSTHSAIDGSPQKVDFFARYHSDIAITVDEFDEFLKTRCEPFNSCDPIKWWAARTSQFPKLSAMARDILSIPGMYIKLKKNGV